MADLKTPANLTPLPLGLTEEPSKPASPEQIDATEAWLQEHPADKEFSAVDTAQAAAAAAPETPAPAVETPAPAAAPEATAKPADATSAPVAATTETPAPAQPTAEAKPAAQPLADDEKIKLTADAEWTRAQIREALKERAAQAPLAKEGDSFRKLFGMPFEDAQKAWGPVLQRLATEPNTVAFLDSFLADASKAAYLEKCAAHYDQQAGAQPPATPQPVVAKNPELEREVAELRTWREQQEKDAAQQRLNREWALATERYPFLATDEALRNDLILTAQALFAQDKSKGLLDALELKRAMYEAMNVARSAQPAPAPAAAAPAQPAEAQPALLGSPGASPTGSRPAATTRPKSFGSLDDAVDDWVYNPPADIRQ